MKEKNKRLEDELNVEKYFEEYKVKVSESNDKESKKEEEEFFKGDLHNIDTWLRHEEFRLKKANKDSERTLREKNARLAFQFSAIWASFIGLIILLKGFEEYTNFNLSQTEFLFIIGSLTTSIFTFYLLVLKYLFYIRNEGNKKVTLE